MSEFTCKDCGGLMHRGVCTDCESRRIGMMDGRTASELAAEEKAFESQQREEPEPEEPSDE